MRLSEAKQILKSNGYFLESTSKFDILDLILQKADTEELEDIKKAITDCGYTIKHISKDKENEVIWIETDTITFVGYYYFNDETGEVWVDLLDIEGLDSLEDPYENDPIYGKNANR